MINGITDLFLTFYHQPFLSLYWWMSRVSPELTGQPVCWLLTHPSDWLCVVPWQHGSRPSETTVSSITQYPEVQVQPDFRPREHSGSHSPGLGAGVSFASVFCAILHTAANHSLIGSVLITRLNNRRKAKHTQSSGSLMLITLTRRCRSFILLGKLQKETQGVSFLRDTGKEKGLNACTVASRNHRALGILRNSLLITSLKKPLASRNSTLLCRCHYILK